MTLYKVRLRWSMTSLRMLSIGTNVYVHVCYIKMLARWQHDKMVSISAATVEDTFLKIIVACQEFKMGYFPWTLSFMSCLKKQAHFNSLIFSGWEKKMDFINVLGKNLIQQNYSKNTVDLTRNLRIILSLSCLVDPWNLTILISNIIKISLSICECMHMQHIALLTLCISTLISGLIFSLDKC